MQLQALALLLAGERGSCRGAVPQVEARRGSLPGPGSACTVRKLRAGIIQVVISGLKFRRGGGLKRLDNSRIAQDRIAGINA